MVRPRPKVTHVKEESRLTSDVPVALAVSDAMSDGMLTETPTDRQSCWSGGGITSQHPAFVSGSKRRQETHSLAKGNTGSELLGRAGRDHALRDALDEGVGRAQALIVGRGARGDCSRLSNAVDDAVSMPSGKVSWILGERDGRVALGTHQVGGAP